MFEAIFYSSVESTVQVINLIINCADASGLSKLTASAIWTWYSCSSSSSPSAVSCQQGWLVPRTLRWSPVVLLEVRPSFESSCGVDSQTRPHMRTLSTNPLLKRSVKDEIGVRKWSFCLFIGWNPTCVLLLMLNRWDYLDTRRNIFKSLEAQTITPNTCVLGHCVQKGPQLRTWSNCWNGPHFTQKA